MIRTIRFKGIDDFNRPVFKVIGYDYYVGSVITLFDWGAAKEDVEAYFRNNTGELEYFGDKFNCEPTGGRDPNIIYLLEDI